MSRSSNVRGCRVSDVLNYKYLDHVVAKYSFANVMKLKNIISMVFIGAFSTSFLVSCDGSSDGGSDNKTEIEIPDDTDQVNGENQGSDANNSGANSNLEASYARQIFTGINGERSQRSLSALTRDSQMDSLAAAHNADMISRATPYGDIDTDHNNAQARANALASGGITAYGENTAGIRGYSSAVVSSTFVDGWVNSPGHFKNITGNYKRTGVAVTVDDRDGTIYATQIFAR